jgi:hypothetical protein
MRALRRLLSQMTVNKKRKKNGRKSILNRRPANLSTRIQSFGPGTTVSRVTNYVEFNVDPIGVMSHAVIDHMVTMAQTEEFERNVNIFKYFKIIGIKIIIQPRLTYEISPMLQGRITYDWTSPLLENILADDGSKEVTVYSTKNTIYKFKPVNAAITSNNYTYNYKDWLPTMNANILTYLPGWIKISSSFPFYFCVETIVAFKGNQTQVNANNNKVIKIKGMKLNHEEEKEEDLKENVEEVEFEEEIKEEKKGEIKPKIKKLRK